MVRVRLKRTGTRNASCFRVVVMDQRSSRDGKAIEELGFYDPRKKEEKINVERANYWKGVGAEFSDTVEAILNRAKEGRNLKDIVKKPSISKKAKAKLEAEAAAKAEAEAAAKAAAEAPAEESRPETRSRKKAANDWSATPEGGNEGFDWEAFQRYDDAAAWEKPKRGGGTRSVRRSGRPVTTGRQAAPKRIAAKGRKR